MSIETIKTLALGLISTPDRHMVAEHMLTTAARSALAIYSIYKPLTVFEGYTTTEAQLGADDKGSYYEIEVPLSTGILHATAIIVNGEHYQHRIIYTTSTAAAIRVYNVPSTSGFALGIQTSKAHDITTATWPAHHEALIALVTASFYLNALAIQCQDANLSDSYQNLASSYYGRATTTLNQLP